MNAVLVEREAKGNRHMLNEDQVAQQIGELRADVRHLQSDVTDVRTEIRGLRTEIRDLRQRVDEQIAKLKDSLSSAKLWAIGLYVTQSGTMLLVMAHGFKWL